MTISADLAAKIRRLYYAEHWKIGTISTELGVHHDAVERVVGIDRRSSMAASRPVPPSLLDAYKPFLLDVLAQHPRLRATRLFEMVKARGYTGGVVVVRRWVRAVRPTPRTEAYFRIETMPGEQAQVDWGHFGRVRVGHADRTLLCFVIVFSYSRAMWARFTLDGTTESLLRQHVLAFEALGGVPRSVLYDNMKSVVLEREGEHIRFHPRLLELAGHYHFAPRPCAPYRATDKGKVERAIQYLRHSFFAARRYRDLDDLNSQLVTWIDEVAHARPVPGDPSQRPVREALDVERGSLLPLPAHRIETDFVAPVTSGKRPYIRFDSNDYSIPHDRVRVPLTLAASETEVRILDRDVEVARHRRSYDRRDVVEAREHLDALAEHKRGAGESRRRDRLRQICPSSDALLSEIARRGQPVGHHTVLISKLVDRFGAADVEVAIAEAVQRGAFSAKSVAHLCDQRRRARGAPPPMITTLPDDPRVRDLRVTPHSLSAYDELANRKDER